MLTCDAETKQLATPLVNSIKKVMGEDPVRDERQQRLANWKDIYSRLPKIPTAIVIGATLAILGLTFYAFQQIRQASQPKPIETPAVAPTESAVSAIGRLEPEGEVITVAAPSSATESKLGRLLVEEGDRVTAGQLIAVLDNTDKLSAALDKAQADVKIAEADYADAQTGGKPGDIAAQEAKVASARVELRGQSGIDAAAIKRLQAQLAGEEKAQNAAIARLQAELAGSNTSQTAAIARLQAELAGETQSQAAILARLRAELSGEKKAQQATIDRLANEIKGESQAQQATVKRIQAQVNNAQVEARRYRNLYREGAISASRFDSKQLELKTLEEQLTEAKTSRRKNITSLEKQLLEAQTNRNKTIRTLEAQIKEAEANQNQTIASLQQQIQEISANRSKSNNTLAKQIQEAQANRDRTIGTLEQEINQAQASRSKNRGTLQQEIEGSQGTLNAIKNPRSTQVQVAQAKLQSALATYKQAKADLDNAYVRSPVNGQIFKVKTRPGEKADDDGIVEIGQNEQMVVTAEVYESDIEKVKVGQKATIVSDSKAFSGELTGEVTRIGLQIGKKDVLNTDPAADVDVRVIEVKIALSEADSQKVAGLTNSKVLVKISL